MVLLGTKFFPWLPKSWRSMPAKKPSAPNSLNIVDSLLLALVEGTETSGRSFEALCRSCNGKDLQNIAAELETYRLNAANFYHRVRSIFFLEALHRYFLPPLYRA